MLRETVINCVDSFLSGESCEADYSKSLLVNNISLVREFNRRGEALCGNASYEMQQHLPAMLLARGVDALVLRATAAPKNSCFHNYNIVYKKGHEPLICDLTSSQFFTRPLDTFGELGFFVGTRQELRQLVDQARTTTWAHIQANFPQKNFSSCWDVDLAMQQDHVFRGECYQSLKNAKDSMLLTESLQWAFEITWGDQSRCLYMPGSARPCIAEVVHEHTPAIASLVTDLNHRDFSRNSYEPPKL
jgi:hypothetical protein